jgi:hypothetical protein
MKRYILQTAAATIILTACVNELDFEGQARDPKLNIYSVFGPDANGIAIPIGASESVFLWGDEQPEAVNDATFTIRRNGVEVPVETTIDTESGKRLYNFSSSLAAGDRLELEGQSPKLGRVTASDVVPAPAVIKDLKAEPYFYVGLEGVRTLTTIVDPAGEKNYYTVVMWVISHWIDKSDPANPSKVDTEELCIIYPDNEILFQNLDDTPYGLHTRSLYFSDELIDGREYTLDLFTYFGSYGGYYYGQEVENPDTELLGRSVRMEIITMSPALFQYKRSVELARFGHNNFLSQPVQVYSNVVGGYGIFGAYNIASKTVEIPLPEKSRTTDK